MTRREVAVLFCVALGLVGCDEDSVLLVNLRTDLQPGVEVTRAELSVDRLGAGPARSPVERALTSEDDGVAGIRLAELSGLFDREYVLTARLFDSDGASVAAGTALVNGEAGRRLVVIVATAECRGMSCDATGEVPETCVGGRCVDARCDPESPGRCAEAECAADEECGAPTVSCERRRCVEGVCLATLDDTACASGRCDRREGCLGDGAPDAGTPDAGPTCGARGLTDTDGDGVCSDVDCHDDDSSTFPGALDVCQRGDAIDEDCDGRFDEGCDPYLEVVHAPISLHLDVTTEAPPFHFAPRPAASGTRLYYAACCGQPPRVAERADARSPFRAALSVGLDPSVQQTADWLSITEDENELFVQRGGEILLLQRSAEGRSFDVMSEVSATAGAPTFHPSVSPDGRELFFTRFDAGVFAVFRATRDDGFSTATRVVAEAHMPSVQPDGRLFYNHPTTGRLFVMERDGDAFLPARRYTGLDQALSPHTPYFAADTGEVFFVNHGPSDPIAPAQSILRGRVCHEERCPASTRVACPDGVASTDGLHCYAASAAAGPEQASIAAACEAALSGSHVATLQTEAERLAVASLAPIGLGFQRPTSVDQPHAWLHAEPLPWLSTAYPSWASGQPTGEPCVDASSPAARWVSVACTARPYLCEREVWPTW